MIFTEPVPFSEALADWRVREIWPTPLTTEEIELLELEFRRSAIFSARVQNIEFLEEVQVVVDEILNGELGTAMAKAQLRDLVRLGDPAALMTDARLELILNTNVEMALGYGQWKLDQDPDILFLYPAQELIRVAQRMEPRDWPTRWRAAGGQFYGGRMIALKNDPIWRKISRFGTPWPPFDFNSGMGRVDIFVDEAEALGVMNPGDQPPTPQDDTFGDVPPSAQPKVNDPQLRRALEASGIGRFDASGRFVATPLEDLDLEDDE
ncbi:MAG: hypothetical protein E1N59_2835 [Puniceicoccaceae bacterium 5H]|nr:MAG: hypothetical protein E1N59_2835 [Puniceicoccaceae bacterium 5H]